MESFACTAITILWLTLVQCKWLVRSGGLNEIVPMRHGSGVVMDWKQSAGILLVGGDSKVIKTWDAQTEMQGLVCLFVAGFCSLLMVF